MRAWFAAWPAMTDGHRRQTPSAVRGARFAELIGTKETRIGSRLWPESFAAPPRIGSKPVRLKHTAENVFGDFTRKEC